MENYEFIYKNNRGQWDICKNPVFIARHTCCRAIPKSIIKTHFVCTRELVEWLNDLDDGYPFTEKQEEFLREYIW